MTEKCPNPECKREIEKMMANIEKNIYGEGPEGEKGVYGALASKFSKWEGRAFFGLIAAVLLSLIMLLVGHEGRIAKNETNVAAALAAIDKTSKSIDEGQTAILKAIHKLSKDKNED